MSEPKGWEMIPGDGLPVEIDAHPMIKAEFGHVPSGSVLVMRLTMCDRDAFGAWLDSAQEDPPEDAQSVVQVLLTVDGAQAVVQGLQKSIRTALAGLS